MVYTLEECCADLVSMTTPETLLFLEKTSPQTQSSMFEKVIQKVKDIKDALVKWIREFFQKHFTKQTEARIDQALDANPELKNKKIQIKDQEKLGKLQNETIKKIKSAKSEAEVDNAMRRYKKQRNAIAVVGIAVVAALGLLYRRKSKQTSAWMDRYDDAAESIETLTGELKQVIETTSETIRTQKAENNILKSNLRASHDELRKTREQIDDLIDKNKDLDRSNDMFKRELSAVRSDANRGWSSYDYEYKKRIGAQIENKRLNQRVDLKNEKIGLLKKQIAALSSMTSDIASDEKASIMELAKATRLVINPANAKIGQPNIPLKMKSGWYTPEYNEKMSDQSVSKADQMRAVRNKKRK